MHQPLRRPFTIIRQARVFSLLWAQPQVCFPLQETSHNALAIARQRTAAECRKAAFNAVIATVWPSFTNAAAGIPGEEYALWFALRAVKESV
jgi:hypothetical protein